MDELAMWLDQERRLLERLLFKLVESRELLAAGEARFLGLAAAELERAAQRVEEADLVRSVQLNRLAQEWQVPVERLTLGALSWVSPEPHRTIFDDQYHDFLALMAEIQQVTGQSRRLAVRGAREAAGWHCGSAQEPGLAGTMLEPALDEAAYQAIIDATAGLSLPSLDDFLVDHGGSPPPEAASTPSTTRASSAGRNGLAR